MIVKLCHHKIRDNIQLSTPYCTFEYFRSIQNNLIITMRDTHVQKKKNIMFSISMNCRLFSWIFSPFSHFLNKMTFYFVYIHVRTSFIVYDSHTKRIFIRMQRVFRSEMRLKRKMHFSYCEQLKTITIFFVFTFFFLLVLCNIENILWGL